MAIGSVEVGGAMVACTSIFTMIISKIKCYYQNPSCLCAYLESKEHELLYANKKIETILNLVILRIAKKQ